MRSPLISFAPASRAIASIRPSTCAGTPESMCAGGVAEPLAATCARTSSWLPPMPPVVTITAWAASANSPAGSRPLASPRLTGLGARTVPATPVDGAAGGGELVDAVAEAQLDAARARPPSRTRRSNGSTTPGPVPQVMWKRGTELPWPSAR